MSVTTIRKRKATSIREGDFLDTDAGPAEVISVQRDPYLASSRLFTLSIPGYEAQPQVAYLGGQLVPRIEVRTLGVPTARVA